MQPAFNNELYIEKQTKHIRERIGLFGDKLYLEFGGKIFDDYHAARVLPGLDVYKRQFQYNTDPDHSRARTCSQCRFRADSDDRALSLRDRAPRIWPYDP